MLMKMSEDEKVSVAEFRRILDEAPDERTLTEYLKNAPRIPYWTFCKAGGHDRYAIPEFPLSNLYKADLLLLNSYSGAWEAIFVEFESADDPVFTKNGVPSKRLAIAQRQIDEWRAFNQRYPDLVRAEMVRSAKRSDCLGYSDKDDEPMNDSGDRLADPGSFFHWHYRIVIGRRSTLTKEKRDLLGRYANGHDVEIVTYDRLLRVAEHLYEGLHVNPNGFLTHPD
jgi:Domain of unknown function (DUF4263)